MTTPQVLLNNLVIGSPMMRKNLELVPLLEKEPRDLVIDYILAAEAFDRGVLRVAEVDEDGSVPELRAVSEADVAILLLDGEELVGAKQNRIMNTDVLLRPHAKKKIPVSCVEQGRWDHTRPDFEIGSHAPPPLRARKSRSVGQNLRESGNASSDQGDVWDGVQEFLEGTATPSETSAMADAFEQHRSELDSLVGDVQCPDEAVGVMALIDGRFAALDLFDAPATIQQYWPRLMMGYAADAVTRSGSSTKAGSAQDVTAILERVRSVECVVCPGVDLGEDWRFETPDLVGSALVVDGAAIHLSAFPNGPHMVGRGPHGGRIQPPSRRGPGDQLEY